MTENDAFANLGNTLLVVGQVGAFLAWYNVGGQVPDLLTALNVIAEKFELCKNIAEALQYIHDSGTYKGSKKLSEVFNSCCAMMQNFQRAACHILQEMHVNGSAVVEAPPAGGAGAVAVEDVGVGVAVARDWILERLPVFMVSTDTGVVDVVAVSAATSTPEVLAEGTSAVAVGDVAPVAEEAHEAPGAPPPAKTPAAGIKFSALVGGAYDDVPLPGQTVPISKMTNADVDAYCLRLQLNKETLSVRMIGAEANKIAEMLNPPCRS